MTTNESETMEGATDGPDIKNKHMDFFYQPCWSEVYYELFIN